MNFFKSINAFFLFLSIVLLFALFMIGIFNYINLILVILYVNSIILLSLKQINGILKSLLLFISSSIFLYILYILYIHIGLGQFSSQFAT